MALGNDQGHDDPVQNHGEPELGEPGPRDADDGDGVSRKADRGWTGWLATGAFVLGLVAGVLLLGLLGQDPPTAPVAQGAAPAPGPGASSGSGGETGRIEVNAACLRAINAAEDIAAAVEDLGSAAAVLDAAQLDEVVRRLQPLQDRLQENTAACEVTGSTPSESAGASPTASPTD